MIQCLNKVLYAKTFKITSFCRKEIFKSSVHEQLTIYWGNKSSNLLILSCAPHSGVRYYKTLDKPIKLCAWHLLLESKVSMIHSKGFFINEQMKYVFSNYLLVTLATRYTFEWIFSFMDWSNMLIKVNMYRFCGFEFGHNVTHNL